MQTNQKCCFCVQKNNNTTKMCNLYSNIAPRQIEVQCSLLYHQKSHLTYDENNSPMFGPDFTVNHITLHIILLPCNNIY